MEIFLGGGGVIGATLESQVVLVVVMTGILICLTELNRERVRRTTIFWSTAVAIICLPTLLGLMIWPGGGVVALIWSILTIATASRLAGDLASAEQAEALWKKRDSAG